MIVTEGLVKKYRVGRGIIAALDGVSMQVDTGQMVVICGPSGCGKTTLLMTIGGLLRPTAGQVSLAGADLYGLSAGERAAIRARSVGFVFQMFHLVPYLTVLENVLLPVAAGRQQRAAAINSLERLGLASRLRHKPSQLSVGERQRVALARATLLEPQVVLADEPTGNLDEENAHEVFRLLSEYRGDGKCVVVVTHGPLALGYGDRLFRMQSGRLEEDESFQAATSAAV